MAGPNLPVEIKDMSYFVNCRGTDFLPSYQSVWDKSGGIPTLYYPFVGAPSSYKSDVMYFAGTTRTSLWTHFNETEIRDQIGILKGCGFNLLRVPLDFYCWSAMGSKFISNARYLAARANDHRIYIQWVLFEGDTQDDVSGLDSANRKHREGGKDPETVQQAVSKGLKYWQRCPTIYQSQLMTRHPSSLVSVGNSYLSSVISNLSGYQATLAWEVMANVFFDSSANPADVSGYQFLTSATSKVRSLIPTHQKITASYKHLTTIPLSPYYSYPLLQTLSSLDYVCYKADNISEVDRYITYANAVSSMIYSKKPIMAVDVGWPNKLSFLRDDVSAFSYLRTGWITDAMIDHNYSVKPNNNSRGVVFPDGECRTYNDIKPIIDAKIRDLNIAGKLKSALIEDIPNTKVDYKVYTLQGADYVNDFTRLTQWGDVGGNIWTKLKDYIQNIPEYKFISSKYAPLDSSVNSKSNGWEIANPGLRLSRDNFTTFFYSLLTDAFLLPLAGLDEVSRDMKAFQRIHTYERIQKSLPITLGTPISGTIYDPSFIAASTQQQLVDIYKIFKPISQGGEERIPYIGTPRYFSSLNNYNSIYSSMYAEPLENCQKPIGFFNNLTASGSCYYNSAINTNKKAVQNVISKIDWATYDLTLRSWLGKLIAAYEELYQISATSKIGEIFGSGIEAYFRTYFGISSMIENTKYSIFSRDILNIKANVEQIIAGGA